MIDFTKNLQKLCKYNIIKNKAYALVIKKGGEDFFVTVND